MIEMIRPATNDEWDNFVCNDVSATFFHTRTWYEIIAKHYNLCIETKLIVLREGKKVLLPLATSHFAKGVGRQFISSPLGTYGGFLSDVVLSKQDKVALYRYLGTLRPLILRENPYSNIIDELCFTKEDFTQVIDLKQPLTKLIALMNKQQIPRKVRQAERHNLQLRKIEGEYIDFYYKIYQDCQQRWGKATNNYSRNLFMDISQSENCDFWGVFIPSDELICAGPFLKTNLHVCSWLALSATQALQMKPYEFLYFHLIQYYKQQGYKWFDFNPSGGHKGVLRFKDSFGAQKLRSNVLITTCILKRLINYVNRVFKV